MKNKEVSEAKSLWQQIRSSIDKDGFKLENLNMMEHIHDMANAAARRAGFPEAGTRGHGGDDKIDAFRHAWSTAWVRDHLGESAALQLSYFVEAKRDVSTDGNDPKARKMDIHNNVRILQAIREDKNYDGAEENRTKLVKNLLDQDKLVTSLDQAEEKYKNLPDLFRKADEHIYKNLNKIHQLRPDKKINPKDTKPDSEYQYEYTQGLKNVLDSLQDKPTSNKPKPEASSSRPLPSSRFVGILNEATGALEQHPKFGELLQKDAPMSEEEKQDLAELFHIRMNLNMGKYPKEDLENKHDSGFSYRDRLVRPFGHVQNKTGGAGPLVLLPQEDPDFKPKRQSATPVPRNRLEAALSGLHGFADAVAKTQRSPDWNPAATSSAAASSRQQTRSLDSRLRGNDKSGLESRTTSANLSRRSVGGFNPYALDNPDLEPDDAQSVYDNTFGKNGSKDIYDALDDKTNPYRPRLMKNKNRLSTLASRRPGAPKPSATTRPSLSGATPRRPGQGLI